MSWLGEIDWIGYFVQSSVKSTAALLLALALAFLLRRRSASLRHFVLALFLIGLVFFPVFSALPSGWETRLLPSWGAGAETARQPIKRESIVPRPPALRFEGRGMRDERGLPAGADDGILIDGFARTADPANFILSGKNDDQPKYGLSLNWMTAAIWASGFLFLLMRIAFGLAGASKLTREGRPLADSAWRMLLYRFLSLTRLRRKVELKSHGEVAVPITWGLIKPVIIMPAEALGWPEDRRSSALFHELSHVKRIDFLIMILARLSLALFWFNPLIWIAFRSLRKEQEKACDELVLRAGIKPSTYAANLLLLKQARRLPAQAHAGFLGLFGKSQLNDRLAAILKQQITLKETKMRTKIMLFVSVVCLMTLIGMARPSGAAVDTASIVADTGADISAIDNLGTEPAITAGQEQKQEQEKAEKAEKQEKKEGEEKKARTVTVKKIKSKDGTVEVIIKEGDEEKSLVMEDADVLELDDLEGDIVVDKDGHKIIIRKGKEPRFVIEGDHWSLYKDDKCEKRIIVEKAPRLGIKIESERGLRKKLEAVQAEIEKIKKSKPEVMESLKDLDKSLKELGEELEKRAKETKEVGLMYDAGPGRYKIIKRVGGKEVEGEPDETKIGDVVILKKRVGGKAGVSFVLEETKELDETKELEKAKKLEVTVEDKDKTGYAIAIKISDKMDKAAYEKAIEKIKKDVPEGFKLESEFDEAKGRMIIKFTGSDPKGEKKDIIKKIVEALKEELKKEPAAK